MGLIGSSWDSPDWRVRRQKALKSRNQKKLLLSAITDVSKEVRFAAVSRIRADSVRQQVVAESECSETRLFALAQIKDFTSLVSLLENRDTSVDVKIAIVQEHTIDDQILEQFVSEKKQDINLRISCLNSLSNECPVEKFYEVSDCKDFKLKLIERITNDSFLEGLYDAESEFEIISAAIRQIRDLSLLLKIYRKETDSKIRRQIVERFTDTNLLQELLEEEDEGEIREAIVERITDESMLWRIAVEDYSLNVRAKAIGQIKDVALLKKVVLSDTHDALKRQAIQQIHDEKTLGVICLSSSDLTSCLAAAYRINSPQLLENISNQSQYPEIRWVSSRRLGKAELDDLFSITNDNALANVANEDESSRIRSYAIRKIKKTKILERISKSTDPDNAFTANMVLSWVEGPLGIPFVDIPGRPYQMSVFPLTNEDVHKILPNYSDTELDAELPATQIHPDFFERIFDACGKMDGYKYRLPWFEEWLHAATMNHADIAEKHTEDEDGLPPKLYINALGPRPRYMAWHNEWGLLDLIGNVLEWVQGTRIDEAQAERFAKGDDLAGQPSNDSRKNEYCQPKYHLAAGSHWADRRLKPSRWERIVNLHNLDNPVGSNKIGLRLIRETWSKGSHAHSVILQPETRYDAPVDKVVEALSWRCPKGC